MDDSESVHRHTTSVIGSSRTQTLDRYLCFRRPKLDDHALARKLFDEIAQQPSESDREEEEIEVLRTGESIGGFEEPSLASSVDAEEDDVSEPSSPLAVVGRASNGACETESRISYSRSVDKPLLCSSSWCNDVYEKPSMVGAGLANLGNTCFLNAVLQCFTHTVLFVQGLYSYSHGTPCDCNSEQFCLFCAFLELVEISLSSTSKVISPWKFVDNLSYFSSSFWRFQQEDAHEFLQCMLDRLETSFSRLKAKNVAFSSQNSNLVKQVFGGCVVSKLRCCNCNHFSDTYEPSIDLSLEIDDANSLSIALESFTKVEHIEDEEMKFTCDRCKEKVSVEKQLMLDRIPPVCSFHLKRFKNDGSYVEKIDKHVEFPLKLDLQPYTCSNRINDVDLKYELYAIIVHEAFTSTCGHYYCYVRTAPDTWYKFDDSKVIEVSEAYVLSKEAYILFYAKHGTPWFSHFIETHRLSFDPTSSHTSPKSVLDHVESSPDSLKNQPKNLTEPIKPKDFVFSASEEVSGGNQHRRIYASAPLGSDGSCAKANSSPSGFLEGYGFSRRNGEDGIFDAQRGGKSTFGIEKVVSPSTPLPRSSTDDEISEEVPDWEKTSWKRQRNKETDNPTRLEALRECRKMAGARGGLLTAALDVSMNKKSRKRALSPRKKYTRPSDYFKRNLAASSFR